MSLRAILLGLLRRPTSGYDLKGEFDASLSHFWAAELSQIYPTLKQLEAEGLVTSQEAAPALGPARRLYRRTRAGTAALTAWIRDGPEERSQRLADLAQVFFLDSLDHEAALLFLAQLEDAYVRRRSTLQAIEKSWREGSEGIFPDDLTRDDFFAYLTLELGIAAAETQVAWCARAIERVRQRGTG